MNENKPKDCIIIGGGISIQEGISLGLKEFLNNKFVITCNYSFMHFSHTLTTFIDKDFYKPDISKIKSESYTDLTEILANEPLIVGGKKNEGWQKEDVLKNTILVQTTDTYYGINALNRGFYRSNFPGGLTGIFSISLATYLLHGEGHIFLLGFDFPKQPSKNIHYYTDIKHRGIGYTRQYEKQNQDKLFKPFELEPMIKIYNVNMHSNIDNFEKITYNCFMKKHCKNYPQEELRAYCIQHLTPQ